MNSNSLLTSLKHNVLPIVVFLTGACVLVIEIAATRVLSPFYGNTIFTVSSVISVILAALSLGYYVGGQLADKYPSLNWFFRIILLSGLVLLLFHFIGLVTLPALGYKLSVASGPLITSLLLFFLPAFLLGTLSPYAVKLQSVSFPDQGIGSVAGKIFFWSTLGSISGSLLVGFVLIPNFGVSEIIIANGVVLFFLGAIPLLVLGKKKHLGLVGIAFIFLLSLLLATEQSFKADITYGKSGVYEDISIIDSEYAGRPTRFFQQDRTSSGAMFLDSDDPKDLVYEYTKYYAMHKISKAKMQNVLVIGGGAYSIPKAILADIPEANVDVSEIEPSLRALAKEYFNVKDDSRLNSYTEDGRRLLHDSEKNYDFIFNDAVYSLFSIPRHFVTTEFFELAKSKLNDDGIFVANMLGDLKQENPSLIMSEIKTFKAVFPNSYFIATDSPNSDRAQNIIFVGFNSDREIDFNDPLITQNSDPIINSLKNKIINIENYDLSGYPVMTDNYSPVEYLTGQVLRRTF